MAGKLYALGYGIYPAIHMDPIEKKPLNHFLPGSNVLSVGSVGCNLTCRMCQNWSLSRGSPDLRDRPIEGKDLLALVSSNGSPSVAFTYNEPTINEEFLMDTLPILQEKRIRTILVTNGYLNPDPWAEVMGNTDAANIDVKGFTERFYKDIAGGRLAPVLDNVRTAHEAGVHIELTYLVIPTENDSMEELGSFCKWVSKELSGDVPLHFTRFHPDHRLTHLPSTPISTLEMAKRIAIDMGLNYVYIGNVHGTGYNDTLCPGCGSEIIARRGYTVSFGWSRPGECPRCGHNIEGVWS
jgi:pyruvate formate lyase activating enzyme